MEQKSCLKMIYKIHSKQLKKANWNLTMPLETAMSDYPEIIVSLNDSQLLRFIDELNGVTEIDEKIREIKKKIKYEKKRPRTKETKVNIKNLYRNLYGLQFKKDYVCVIMDTNADYDRANQGFSIIPNTIAPKHSTDNYKFLTIQFVFAYGTNIYYSYRGKTLPQHPGLRFSEGGCYHVFF